jgi:hypothetical protein
VVIVSLILLGLALGAADAAGDPDHAFITFGMSAMLG